MMDIFDRAQEADELFQRQALNAIRSPRFSQKVERPLVENGVTLCLDCEEPIPPARLAAVPGAVRCARCQAMKERKS